MFSPNRWLRHARYYTSSQRTKFFRISELKITWPDGENSYNNYFKIKLFNIGN